LFSRLEPWQRFRRGVREICRIEPVNRISVFYDVIEIVGDEEFNFVPELDDLKVLRDRRATFGRDLFSREASSQPPYAR
jgi:hypothetical protein